MFEDLVKRLRRCEQFRCRGCEYEQVNGCRGKLNAEAAVAIEELQKLTDAQLNVIKQYQVCLTKPHWISVMEGLPEHGERVLVTNGGGFVCESFLAQNGKWQRGGVDMFFMTPAYWMPLPSPPKMKEPFVKDMIAPNKNESEDENNG